MAVILLRTLIFYIVLTAIMRLMGKRQIGELQVSEFVTAFLISEMAALPVTDIDIPLMHGFVAICTLGSLETLISFAAQKSVAVRRALTGDPVVLISDGKVIEKALSKARITLDEVFAQIRGAGYRSIGDVQYVILEQNGKMSVLPKAAFDRLTPDDMGVGVRNSGMTHPVIIDGRVNRPFAEAAKIAPDEAEKEARRHNTRTHDILYMTCDNLGNKVTVKKEKKR